MNLWKIKLIATSSRGIVHIKTTEYEGHDVDLYVKRLVTDFIFTHGLLNMTIRIKSLYDPLESRATPQLPVELPNKQH